MSNQDDENKQELASKQKLEWAHRIVSDAITKKSELVVPKTYMPDAVYNEKFYTMLMGFEAPKNELQQIYSIGICFFTLCNAKYDAKYLLYNLNKNESKVNELIEDIRGDHYTKTIFKNDAFTSVLEISFIEYCLIPYQQILYREQKKKAKVNPKIQMITLSDIRHHPYLNQESIPKIVLERVNLEEAKCNYRVKNIVQSKFDFAHSSITASIQLVLGTPPRGLVKSAEDLKNYHSADLDDEKLTYIGEYPEDVCYYIEKHIRLQDNNEKYIHREIDVNISLYMQKMKNCAAAFAYKKNLKSKTKDATILMKYIPCKPLENLIKDYFTFYECDIRKILQDIACGLQCLHSHSSNIIYRDLKTANVLVGSTVQDEIMAWLIDFGAARTCTEYSGVTTSLGTQSTMAPEAYTPSYDKRVDIYSFGAVIYECIYGKKLYDSIGKNNQTFLYTLVCSATRKISIALIDLLQRCIQKDPNNRIQTIDLLLQHPFFDPESKESKTIQSKDIEIFSSKLIDIKTMPAN